jgi:integrase
VRKQVTKRAVDALKPGEYLVDTEVRGFVARCLPSGVLTYGFRYWNRATARRRWIALGIHGTITPDEARTVARKYAGAVADNRDPLAERVESRAEAARIASTKSVNDVLDEFLTRYVRKNRLRSADEIESSFRRHVRPWIGVGPIYGVRRTDIIEMLDAIEDNGSARLADTVLAQVRKAFNWWASRDEQFNSPIVRGMARTKLRDFSRHRILTDDEIRQVWKAFDGFQPEAYERIGRVLMLTAARLNEIARLRWDEIGDGVFNIPAERHKAKTNHTLPILPAVAGLIGTRPDKRAEFVFSTRKGTTPFSGFSKAKKALDRRINSLRDDAGLEPIPDWRIHDLRRTARSLMSRAGVVSDIAERVLGHVLPGVRGVYDRHGYIDEKREALARLGTLMERILEPPAENVVELAPKKKTVSGGR